MIYYLDILRNVDAVHGRNITTATLLGSETSSFILSLNCDMCDILSGPSLFFIFFLRLPTSSNSGAEICQLGHISIPAWMHRIYNLWMQLYIFLIVKKFFYMSSCTEINLESILWHHRISISHSTMIFIYLFLDNRYKGWIFEIGKSFVNDGQPWAGV